MTVDFGSLAPALLLLLFPADRLLSSAVELRTFGSFHTLENSPGRRPWWWVPVLGIDPVRAWGGTVLLRMALAPGANDWAATDKGAYWAIVAGLLAGVVAQLPTRRDSTALLAPLGYAAGIVAALVPWTVTLIGLAAALTGMFGLRHFPGFFAVGILAVGGLGFALHASAMWLLPALGVLATPIVAAALTRRSLEIPALRDGRTHR